MMGMRGTAAVIAATWMLVPGHALGADAQLSVGGGVEWDNNVGRVGAGPTDDFVFRVNPKLRFLEDEGKATWNLFYSPTYDNGVKTDLADGFRHYFTGTAGYHLSDATQFFVRDNFQFSDAVNTVTALDDQGAGIIASDDERVLRNNLIVGVNHNFTPRLQGRLALSHRYFNSDLESRSDNQSYGGNASVRYKYTPLHTLGIGLAATRQVFDASSNGQVAKSDSLFVNLFGTWEWQIDETTNFEITLGPTFVDSNQEAPPTSLLVPAFVILADDGTNLEVRGTANCRVENMQTVNSVQCSDVTVSDPADRAAILAAPPVLASFPVGMTPSAGSDTAWTIFGEAKFRKRWAPNLTSELAYSRRDSTASGVGGSTVLDYVYFLTSWTISPLWDTSVRADWTMRQSTGPRRQDFVVLQSADGALNTMGVATTTAVGGLTSSQIRDDVDTSRYGVAWRLTRRITERFSVSTRYTYVRQESAQDSNGASSDFNDHLVTLNFQYDFDRWTLW